MDKLREKETGSTGRAAGDTGTSPCTPAQPPGDTNSRHRGLGTQGNVLGAAGGMGKAWQGQGWMVWQGGSSRQSPGHGSHTC